MPDWRKYVRERLSLEDVDDARREDIVDELAAELEERYEAARADGLDEAEALRAAEREVDDWDELADSIVRERGRTAGVRADRNVEAAEGFLRRRGGRWLALADGLQSVRLSARRLRRTPGFSAVVLVTLAVAIGANSALFSVINGILLKPLPYDEPDRLVSVWASAPGMGQDQIPQSPAVHFTYEDESGTLESTGLWTEGEVTAVEPSGPQRLPAAWMTSGLLRALRLDAIRGRRFLPEEDVAGAPPTALLSYAYWQSRFGGADDAIGRTVTVNGMDREIVGVLPERFRLFETEPAIYLPLPFDRSRIYMGNFMYRSLARLAPGVTIEGSEAELTRLMRVAVDRFPGAMTAEQLEQARGAALLRPLRDEVVGDIGDTLWLLLGGVAVILVIACANVANLFLVRAESRERELAVRSALGAGGGRITGEFLIESLILGLLGGVLGTWLAYGGLRVLLALAPPDIPRLSEISLDPTVLGYTLAISLVSGIAFGLFPVWRYRRIDALGALKEGGRGAGASRERHRTRNTLVVAQMAMALVLLIGSGLLIRSFQNLLRVQPGFVEPDRVLTFGVSIPGAEIADLDAVATAHERIADRLALIPGVSSVGLTTSVTMDGAGGFDPLWTEDFPTPEGQLPPIRRFKWVGPGYFETMGNPVIAGRSYTWDDIRNRAPYAVITENLAREYWGEPAVALGRHVRTGNATEWREIIGVVGDVRDDGLSSDPVPIVYWPMAVENLWGQIGDGDLQLFVSRTMEYVVRSDGVGGPGFSRAVRDAVQSVNANLPLDNPRTVRAIVRASLARASFTLVTLAIAAAMALLLGAVGVYGVISYVVSQRTREIGVRVVLGAESWAVKRMVLVQGLRLAAVGIGVGLVTGVLLTRLMRGLLFGVDPLDPITFAAVAMVLTAVALLASYVPAHRASRVDPIEAIRAE